MSNKIPENMSNRIPENLPIRNYIDIMVGIIRNKIII